MKRTTTAHARKLAAAEAPWATRPLHRRLVMDKEMINLSAPERPLPCRADRRKIVERAELILAEARAVAEQSDGSFALLAAEAHAESWNAAPRPLVGTSASVAFLADQVVILESCRL